MFQRRNKNCPFYYMTSSWQESYRTVKKICFCRFVDVCPFYALVLGILGLGTSLFDIVRLVQCNSTLFSNSKVCKNREVHKLLNPKHERDLKLMSLVLSAEHYFLLFFGSFTQNSSLLIPWLLLYAFLILVEFGTLVYRLFVEGITANKHNLALSIFMTYNWISIYCLYFRLLNA